MWTVSIGYGEHTSHRAVHARMPAPNLYLGAMLRTTLLAVVASLGTALHAAPPVPAAPPADIETLAKATPADEATATRQLTEAGVPIATRRGAAAFLAKATGTSVPAAVFAVIEQANGTCGGARDLGELLEQLATETAADAAFMDRMASIAKDAAKPSALRIPAHRALAAVPADKRPEAAKSLAVRTIALKTIPGAMKYDVVEIRAKPGELLHVTLENTDTMQHNVLVVQPGKMAEVGVAADKMGETPEGKARQFVPDLPSVLEVMGLVDPGKSGNVFFLVPDKEATYPYVCTYPGHWRMMNGKIKVSK
jgi:azurin